MARVAKSQKITKDTEAQILDETINRLYRAVNGKLSLDDNLDMECHNVTIGENNGTIKIRHNLSRTPAGFFQADSTAQGTLYRNDPWTANDTEVEISATVSGSYKVVLF